MKNIAIKRIYEPASQGDGFRVLVDRIWPRGLSKEQAALDLWAKELAPSSGLRKWFNHEPAKWEEFRERYRAELRTQTAAIDALLGKAGKGPITLLYGARDEEHNQARVLKELLETL